MAEQTNPAIEEACRIIMALSCSEKDRAIAEAREKLQMDMDLLMNDARQDGREEGFREGLRRVAENALCEGMPVETVVKISGFSLEEVSGLEAARTSPAIEKACGIIRVLSGSERDRAIAEAREKAQMDMDSMIGDARHEGREEGLQEGVKKGLKKGLKKGRQEGKLEVARNALREGMSVETVVKISGLSLEEIKRLAAGLTD